MNLTSLTKASIALFEQTLIVEHRTRRTMETVSIVVVRYAGTVVEIDSMASGLILTRLPRITES